MIEVFQNSFNINGKKTFIYGGELHYFRISKEIWEDRIKQVKDAGCNLISTYIPWIWHEKEEGKIDLTGESTPERDLKTFLKMLQENEMYCLVRPGPYVMSEIKNHGIPYWINENYEEVVAKQQDGRPHPTGVVSYLHPIFINKVDTWYKAVCKIIEPFQITEGGNVIMFQLDNEVGMLQWVTNQADYNEDTLRRFVNFIKRKYSIDKLNKILGVPIKKYDELKELLKKPSKEYAIKIQNEFMLFMREYYREYIQTLKSIAIKHGIKVPFVVNIHGFDSSDYAKRGTRYPIGLSQLYEAVNLDGIVAAGDYYIGNIVHENYHDIVLANAFTKAIQNENQPLFSAEFQGGFQYGIPRLQPTTFDLTTRLCIANGMNAINFYMFVGGENYENIGLLGKRHDWQAPIGTDGSKRKHYYTIKHLSNVIKAIEVDLLETKRDIVTYIGFYPDYYMTEYTNEYTREMYDRLKLFRESYLFNGIARGLVLNNITFEGFDIKKQPFIDVEKVKSLWVMSSHWMDKEVQYKLVKYIKDGGKLVLFPSIPIMDMKGNPCTVLLEALKVEVSDSYWYKFVKIDDIDSVGAGYIETYNGEDLQGFAYLEEEPNKCCAFEKYLGKGKIVVFGIGLELEQFFKDTIVKKLAERVDNFPVTNKNDYIDVSFRVSLNSEAKFMFIQNYDEYEKTMIFDYHGEKLFDGQAITILPRSGLILPLNYPVNESTNIIYSTCELVKNNRKEIEVLCKQNREVIKFTKKIEVISKNIDYQLIEEKETYKLIINNCFNTKVKIRL